MIDVNIFGVCIIRDIFNLPQNDTFSVKKYAQFISPYALSGNSNIIKDSASLEKYIDDYNTSNFKKRNLKIDLTKTLSDFLSEAKSDYLLIDVACSRFDLYWFPDKKTYTTKSLICDEIYDKDFLDKNLLVDTDSLSDDLAYKLLDVYCENILKLYKPEQIILFEIKALHYMLVKEKNKIINWGVEQSKKYNRRIKRAYDYVKLKLSGCHIIEFPNGTLLDENHYLGSAVLHYIQDYYNYCYDALKIISNKLPLEVEKISLINLKYHYEHLMYDKYINVLKDTLKYYADKEALGLRLSKYVTYFKDLLLDEQKRKNIVNFFSNNNISSCAFYGASEISRFLISYFKVFIPNLKIDYIIEETNLKSYENIPYIGRYSLSYPETELIIISDIVYIKEIYKKLNDMNINAQITDVYKLLKSD